MFWSQDAKKLVDKTFLEENPIAVIGDMVRSTEYIRDLPIRKIADLDDRISLRYQRELDADLDEINPYGSFLHVFPSFLRGLLLLKPVKKFVVKNEIYLLNEYELEIGQICDTTIFVAEKEAVNFNSELGQDKAVSVPIGVDVEYFQQHISNTKENTIGFLGALSVAHNENAVRYFIRDILPDIVKKRPNIKFLVIGGRASDDLKKLQSDNVVFTGWVDDVRDYLAECKVFVCPMTFGSGIKTKNLEAMAMGIPLVTTSIGAENIDAIDGEDWIITDEKHEFANAVCELLDNEDKRMKIGENGRSFVIKKWTWTQAKDKLSQLI